jgi:hypothetical protein
MKKVVIGGVVAALLLGGSANAQSITLPSGESDPSNGLLHRTGGREGAFAAGVAIGVLGGLALPRPPRRYDYYRHRQHMRLCRRWRWMCHDGSERACWQFDTRC